MHSPFPYGLCDPRQSLHLSWGNQPSRQLFPPLSLSLSPPPSSLLGGGSAALSSPAGCPRGAGGAATCTEGPPSLPVELACLGAEEPAFDPAVTPATGLARIDLLAFEDETLLSEAGAGPQDTLCQAQLYPDPRRTLASHFPSGPQCPRLEPKEGPFCPGHQGSREEQERALGFIQMEGRQAKIMT